MNGTQIADVIARHHLVWGTEAEATCLCGWSDLSALFGYHLLGLFMDICDAEGETVDDLSSSTQRSIAGQSVNSTGMQRDPLKHSVQVEPTAETEPSDPPPTNLPDPRAERMLERSVEPDPVQPNPDDLRAFELIRSGEAGSYNAVDRLLGVTPSKTYQRFDILERYGTLPDDMLAWRKTRRNQHGGNAPRLRSVDALGRLGVEPGEWSPDCMTAADYSDWRRFNEKIPLTTAGAENKRAERPCEDCPLPYSLEMRAEGKCNGTPGKAVSA